MPPLDKMLGMREAKLHAEDAAIAERKPSAVEIGAGRLAAEHTRLDALIGELERKIVAILIPGQGGQGQNPSTRPPDPVLLSPMANGLKEAAGLVAALADRLDAIIARVDL